MNKRSELFVFAVPRLESLHVMEVDGSHVPGKISFGIVVLFINHRFGVESSRTQCFTFILDFVLPPPHPSHIHAQSHSVL